MRGLRELPPIGVCLWFSEKNKPPFSRANGVGEIITYKEDENGEHVFDVKHPLGLVRFRHMNETKDNQPQYYFAPGEHAPDCLRFHLPAHPRIGDLLDEVEKTLNDPRFIGCLGKD